MFLYTLIDKVLIPCRQACLVYVLTVTFYIHSYSILQQLLFEKPKKKKETPCGALAKPCALLAFSIEWAELTDFFPFSIRFPPYFSVFVAAFSRSFMHQISKNYVQMPRDSSRNNRLSTKDRSHGLSEFELARQRYRELEEQLKEKDRLLTERAKVSCCAFDQSNGLLSLVVTGARNQLWSACRHRTEAVAFKR